MRIAVDPQADALYLKLRDGAVHETRALLDFRVVADFDANGVLLGLEVLGVNAAVDEFGYAQVDVAVTSGEGRQVDFDPAALVAAQLNHRPR